MFEVGQPIVWEQPHAMNGTTPTYVAAVSAESFVPAYSDVIFRWRVQGEMDSMGVQATAVPSIDSAALQALGFGSEFTHCISLIMLFTSAGFFDATRRSS
eukprot:s46_g29.t1